MNPALRAGAAIARWAEARGLPGPRHPAAFDARFPDGCRPPAVAAQLDDWEGRYGFALPESLRAWLLTSNGLFAASGPLIHPLGAIGPMIPFARVPGMMVPPESWFELGNPESEAICIDLGYRWPGDDHPIFTSGDDARGLAPKLIATGFEAWLQSVAEASGAEYWSEPGRDHLGDPWAEHRRHVPAPPLAPELLGRLPRALALLDGGADEWTIAEVMGLARDQVEGLVRHAQHRRQAPPPRAG